MENTEIEKSELIKALDEAGHRESALLLKNWNEMDDIAKSIKRSSFSTSPGTRRQHKDWTDSNDSLNNTAHPDFGGSRFKEADAKRDEYLNTEIARELKEEKAQKEADKQARQAKKEKKLNNN